MAPPQPRIEKPVLRTPVYHSSGGELPITLSFAEDPVPHHDASYTVTMSGSATFSLELRPVLLRASGGTPAGTLVT
jgi:hypothetical protein